jgi:hypothetical protein
VDLALPAPSDFLEMCGPILTALPESVGCMLFTTPVT